MAIREARTVGGWGIFAPFNISKMSSVFIGKQVTLPQRPDCSCDESPCYVGLTKASSDPSWEPSVTTYDVMVGKVLLTTMFHVSRSPYGKSGIPYEDQKTRLISRLGC